MSNELLSAAAALGLASTLAASATACALELSPSLVIASSALFCATLGGIAYCLDNGFFLSQNQLLYPPRNTMKQV